MLDLQKYAKRAEADPEFRAKLLKNANQAIKDEFGEDLPYALKCKEKLSFEVESMDGLSDGDFEGVAGGSTENLVPVDLWKEQVRAAGYKPGRFSRGDGKTTGWYACSKYDGDGIKQTKKVEFVKADDGEWYVKVE